MARVVIQDATYENVHEVIPEILRRFDIDWNGKRVLVKPNMLGHFNFDENSGSTTHPAVVSAIVKALRNRGAAVIVGDNPALQGLRENQRCARRSGILEASDGAYKNISNESVEVRVAGSKLLDKVLVSKDILDVDYVINAPRFKASGAMEWSFDFGRWGVLMPRYDFAFTDDIYFDPTKGRGVRGLYPEYATAQPAYWIHNARLGYRLPGSNIEIAGWVRNFTGEVYETFAFDAAAAFQAMISLIGEPRTYGGSISISW